MAIDVKIGLWITGAIVAAFLILLFMCMCKAAGLADEDSERILKELLAKKKEKNDD